MAKVKISNAKIDTLLQAAGKAKIVKDYSIGKSKITTPDTHSIKITPLMSEIKEDGGEIVEHVKIRIDSISKNGSRESIREAINLAPNLDYTMSIPSLIDLNENQSLNLTKANPSYSIDVNFNYVSQDYDNLQLSIDEKNLNSAIDETTKDEVLNFKKRKGARISNFSRGDSMKNFVLHQGDVPKLDEKPYYIRTNVNDTIPGDLSVFLQKIQMFDETLNDYLASTKKEITVNRQNGTMVLEDKIKVYDLKSFFSSEIKIDLDNFYGINQSTASKMSHDLRKHLLKGYLKKASTIGFRTFKDILNGVECYKEAFAYSLEKFEDIETEATRIQNLFVPAGLDNARFIDTQVKYGKTYSLNCKAHYMVVGNSYKYENVRFVEEDGITYALADVINTPSIIIKPMNLFSAKKNIIQPPPVHPQITFRTENNSSKEIQIYFSPTKTDLESNFITITEQDEIQQEMMTKFFKDRDSFRFESLSESGLFETFRMSSPPKSYQDFANSKLSETRMAFSTGDAILRDFVSPNTDYYYTFRQINQKGLVSNPTRVFKVRLVVDADDSKVIVEDYNFPKQVLYQPRVDFKSLVQIRPSIDQTLFNEMQDALFNKNSLKGTLDKLKLGASTTPVWGRKIKLRFKSKTSGKILDVNIDFNLRKNKTKEEF